VLLYNQQREINKPKKRSEIKKIPKKKNRKDDSKSGSKRKKIKMKREETK
jgi:hypothetical protein